MIRKLFDTLATIGDFVFILLGILLLTLSGFVSVPFLILVWIAWALLSFVMYLAHKVFDKFKRK